MTNISANYNYLPLRQDPDAYAKIFATQNGITLDEARARTGMHRAEQDESIFASVKDKGNGLLGSSFNTSLDDLEGMDGIDGSSKKGFMEFIRELFGLNSTQGIEPQDLEPEKVAKEYAIKYNLTLDEANKQLSAQYGDPEQKNN